MTQSHRAQYPPAVHVRVQHAWLPERLHRRCHKAPDTCPGRESSRACGTSTRLQARRRSCLHRRRTASWCLISSALPATDCQLNDGQHHACLSGTCQHPSQDVVTLHKRAALRLILAVSWMAGPTCLKALRSRCWRSSPDCFINWQAAHQCRSIGGSCTGQQPAAPRRYLWRPQHPSCPIKVSVSDP